MSLSRPKLPEYWIPQDLKDVLLKNAEPYIGMSSKSEQFLNVLQKLKNIGQLELATCHYYQFLKLCLYLEEFQQSADLKKYNLVEKKIQRISLLSNHFRIYIKDLDKDHPAHKSCHLIRITETKDVNKKAFTLKIKGVSDDYITVHAFTEFCDEYHPDKLYNIKFKMNNYSFRCCHYALSQMRSRGLTSHLFPVKETDKFSFLYLRKNNITETKTIDERWFNKTIADNPEQKQAVLNIIRKSAAPSPYILYGPPGTGKTATLAEAICQISDRKLGKILICTPSNAAADVITKRLLTYIDGEIIDRVYSQSRDPSLIDKEIKKCSNYRKGQILKPNSNFISTKKIIISTLCTCSRLFFLGVEDMFSYIFIDEAGQATEPEALVAFNMASSFRSCQIVLSGDPQQLGPCVRSKLAEPILGLSILERLMKLEVYKKNCNTEYDSRYITRLRRNYRSHPAIIRVSNELYYDNDLIPCSTQKPFVHTKFPSNFPVIFHGIDGEEEKEHNSTSSFNSKEAEQVLEYVRLLVGKRIDGKLIANEDIGIVTPFTLQSQHLQRMLRQENLDKVEVGTVEIFQGQEKDVIIVTAVRSKTFVHNEREHIGFLSNPRRFNVALTRPRAILVVVGNPTVLQIDHNWRHFLKFCQDNDACRGATFKLPARNIEKEDSADEARKSTKSTDLFDQYIKILDIDDGIIKERKIKNKDSLRPYRSTGSRSPMLSRFTDVDDFCSSFDYLSLFD